MDLVASYAGPSWNIITAPSTLCARARSRVQGIALRSLTYVACIKMQTMIRMTLRSHARTIHSQPMYERPPFTPLLLRLPPSCLLDTASERSAPQTRCTPIQIDRIAKNSVTYLRTLFLSYIWQSNSEPSEDFWTDFFVPRFRKSTIIQRFDLKDNTIASWRKANLKKEKKKRNDSSEEEEERRC